MRAELPDLVWLLESCARDRGLDTAGWRPYPSHHGPLSFGIGVTFRVHADGTFSARIQGVEPPRAKRRKRRLDAPPVKVPPAEAMDSLEAQLAASLAAVASSSR